MRVLYVSKASIVSAYQDKLRALTQHVTIDALIPERWGMDRAPRSADMPHDLRIRAVRVFLHGHNHLHMYADVARLVQEAAPELVHLDEEPYSAVTFQFARICRRLRVPFIFFGWQNLPKRIPQPFAAMRAYVYRHAAGAVAGTPRAADVMRASGWRGATVVIPQLGVAADRFKPDTAARVAARICAGMPKDAFVVGYAGRLVPEKGVDTLIDAAASLAAAHVLVIGDGPDRSRLEQRAAARGLSARTSFAGRVDSLDIPLWLNALDVLVLPSRTTRGWTEQFGRVLIEAMACGIPVIGSATGEIPHVIGDAGLIFDEGDSASLAARLAELHDARRRAELGARGRARVLTNFTQQHVAAATAAFYRGLLPSAAAQSRDRVWASG